MIEFIYLFLFRALSGGQNGFGYAEKKTFRIITSFLMIAVLAGTFFLILQRMEEGHWKILTIIAMLVSICGAIGVEDSFNPSYKFFKTDIHFWEILATGGITIAWMFMGGNLITIAASVYPGLILHKGFINLGSSKGWWYHGTDDATGKTFNIPLLNIKVPRLSTRGRITIAVISVLVMIVNETALHWKVTVEQILLWIL